MGSCKGYDVNPQEWLYDLLIRIEDYNSQKPDEFISRQCKFNHSQFPTDYKKPIKTEPCSVFMGFLI